MVDKRNQKSKNFIPFIIDEHPKHISNIFYYISLLVSSILCEPRCFVVDHNKNITKVRS